MIVVVFRSRLRDRWLDESLGPKMLDLARSMPGFVSFESFAADGGERVSIIEFDTMEHLEAWRDHPEHKKTQQLGRDEFYSEYRLQICQEMRSYSFDGITRRDHPDVEVRAES